MAFRQHRHLILLLIIALVSPLAITSAQASCTLTVTNTNTSGAGSLRDAITTANGSSDVDTICFNIPGSGVKTISPTTVTNNDIPAIGHPVIIDGTTQPGYSGVPLIQINGANAGSAKSGIVINAGNSTIRGLIVNRFSNDGIILNNNGGNTIVGNYVGVDETGTTDLGNGTSGIGVATPNNIIGGTTSADRNLVSGNQGSGIAITGSGASNNTISGNYIGTNISGSGKVGNSADGILITYGTNNTVGGTVGVNPTVSCTGSCNLVSGNGANGIGIQGGTGNPTNGNQVKGNYVGVNVTGTSAVANGDIGFEVQSGRDNTIGGTTPEERNIFSGNLGAGVSITGTLATGNVVKGNYIGVNKLGSSAIKNHKMGVNIGSPDGSSNNASSNVIGGTTGTSPNGSCTGACNIIAGNAWSGVYISGSNGGNNQLVGNFIGVGASGGWTIPNIQDGVGIINSPNNRIGGSSANARNLISGNGGNGVAIVGDASTGTKIEGNYIGIATDQNVMANNVTGVAVGGGVDTLVTANSIYGNGFLGIDLSLGGVSPNDGGDADSGPNRIQNYPTLSYAIPVSGGVNIAGSLNSNGTTPYKVEFFHSPACGQHGYGQGHTYIGSTPVTTDATGNTSFNITLPSSVIAGRSVTATATKLGGSTPFETSEFSNCVYTPRQHPDGALIRPAGSQSLFIVKDGGNGKIGSVEVLISHFIDLREFKAATTGDTGAPGRTGLYFREGTLIRGSGPDVFVIDQTGTDTFVKRKITSNQAFNDLGYSLADLITVSDSALGIASGPNIINASVHPDGTLVKNGGTIYLIEDNQKRQVGSPGVLISNRYTVAKLKQATAGDLALSNGPNVKYREGALVKGSAATVYVIDHSAGTVRKRQFGSPQAFTELGYSNADILTVPNQELPAANGPGL